jgi:hypothetical protein
VSIENQTFGLQFGNGGNGLRRHIDQGFQKNFCAMKFIESLWSVVLPLYPENSLD